MYFYVAPSQHLPSRRSSHSHYHVPLLLDVAFLSRGRRNSTISLAFIAREDRSVRAIATRYSSKQMPIFIEYWGP